MADIPDPLESLEAAGDKAFTRRVALTTVLYAVILAITSLGGNNATKEMLLAQQQSSDQWAFYQAKVIREQIAIVIASVSILSTSRMLYAVSLVFAAVGVLLCGNGYLLLIPFPF